LQSVGRRTKRSIDHAALIELAGGCGNERNAGAGRHHTEDHMQMIGPVRIPGDEACPTACLEDRIMKDGHGVARGQDEWFVRKGRQLEAAPRGEAVLWRQCHDERLADDNFAVQGGVTDRGAYESHIELAIEERRELQRH
jgi:hypothetical protein